jgi:hypothetical protein
MLSFEFSFIFRRSTDAGSYYCSLQSHAAFSGCSVVDHKFVVRMKLSFLSHVMQKRSFFFVDYFEEGTRNPINV